MTTAFVDAVYEMVAAGRLRDAIDTVAAVARAEPTSRSEATLLMAAYQRAMRGRRSGLVEGDSEIRRLEAWALEFAELLVRRSPQKLPFEQVPVDVPVEDALPLEKILGGDNLRNVAWLRRGLECARSVCRVVTTSGLGTGFLTQGILLTNHHVLPSPLTATEAVAEFNFEVYAPTAMPEVHRYALDASRFWTDARLDATLVGLRSDGIAGTPDRWEGLVLESKASPKPGDHVSIIQHPGGGPKQLACTANQVVNVYDHRLQYLTDTLPGSSGAPVFDDAWRVIAIHRAGGNLKTNDRGDTRYVNEGVLVSALLSLMGSAGLSISTT
ncbi:trypsin-like peptidase domain-containing protein [Rhizobacter sp. AJA081-3]|uniref:trypsin-like serine peptidase n=1 Tax=Rhizobacter sp. AJA081-3 TaxID=2753607 RepID=UPI001ADF9951|nr:serine protease [Rhizobacter sp. AJA081-3]QTN21796.1 trypsin-like peptidase domain-containing protein [Rhizobacter sp. AJA081-3]